MPYRNLFLSVFSALTIVWGLSLTPAGTAIADSQNDWERWGKHNPAESHSPDHTFFTKFLEAYGHSSKGETLFAYKLMEGQGIKYLEAYSNYLESIPVSKLNRNEQLAFWLNLYNAGAIRAIGAEKSVPRRMDKRRGIPGTPGQMWSTPRFKVEGRDLSLEDIEMNILARHWASTNGNPMWIYGLTYGSKGSPSIPLTAFSGQTVDAELSKIATNFLKRSKSFRVRKNKLELSSLYDWHRSSIGKNDLAVIQHLAQFTRGKQKTKLERMTEISSFQFNWSTNKTEMPGMTRDEPVDLPPRSTHKPIY